MLRRTKLSRGKEIEETPESYNSHLAAPQTDAPEKESARNHIVAVSRGVGRGTKALIATFLFAVFIVIAVYTALAGSLMFTAPLDDRPVTERAWIARGTFVGGKVEPGTIIYGSTTTYAPNNFVGKVLEGYTGAPDYFIAESIAGPIAEVTTKGDKIYVNGKDTGYTGNIETRELKNQYLALCISGSCEKGELIVAEYDAISGEVRGILYPFGLTEVNSSKDVTGDEPK